MDNEQTQTDVIDSSSPAVEAPVSTDVSSAPATEQGESQTPPADDKGQAAAAFQVPENDDDLKGKENDPHVQAIIQMRGELRARDKSLDEYKAFEPWKEVVSTIGDPSLAQSAHELISAIHTPEPNNPSGFTARPFLDQLQEQSQGSVQQIFADILSFPEAGPNGEQSTVVRELVRSWGLDPDRVEEYRNIDSLRASGVVTAEDLGKVPEQYREAFKTFSPSAREDLLDLLESKPLVAEEQLRNAKSALEVQQWRQQEQQRVEQVQQQQQREFEQRVETAVTEGVATEVKSIHDSIHQNLASQWKPSTDETQNSLEYAKVMSTLATLQNPQYRFVAEQALKSVGVELNGFDDLTNRWQERLSAAIVHEQIGDKLQAARAKSEASIAKQQILAKLNDYARKLAQVSGDRLQSQSQQTASQLAAASARFVPNGSGNAQQANQNPYMNNPYPVGTQEYYAHNRKIDKEYQLTGASMFGS